MIVEQLPEVQKLPLEMKLALAAELFEERTQSLVEEPDPELVDLLHRRYEEYRSNPGSVSPWTEVKARILKSRDA